MSFSLLVKDSLNIDRLNTRLVRSETKDRIPRRMQFIDSSTQLRHTSASNNCIRARIYELINIDMLITQ